MSADFAAAHDELRAVAREMLGKAGPDWAQLAAAGWLGLEVPEALGGAGATFAEAAVVLEEMGRAATAGPYLGTAVLGVGALALLAPGAGRDDLLRRVAAGECRLAVALDAERDPRAGGAPFRLAPAGDGLRLDGDAGFVPDAAEADRLLLVALDPEGRPTVVAVAPDHPGIGVSPRRVVDATRRLGRVTADGARVEAAAVWRFAGDPGAAAGRLVDRAALAVACDSLGLAGAMLDATVAYARVRHQFGRPIGSFQAVKHACADMLVEIAVGRELVGAALAGLVGGDPGAGLAVARAKAHVCGAAVDIAGKAMQLHGGIGYTWESGVHVYLKRAALDRSLFGSPRAHRRRIGERLAVTPPGPECYRSM